MREGLLQKQRVFRELRWSLPLPGGSPCLNVSLSSPTINIWSWKKKPRKPCQFQGLPKFFSSLFPELMSLPWGRNILSQRKFPYNTHISFHVCKSCAACVHWAHMHSMYACTSVCALACLGTCIWQACFCVSKQTVHSYRLSSCLHSFFLLQFTASRFSFGLLFVYFLLTSQI